MFKKLMYEKVVTQLNDNTQDTVFKGGYLIGLYGQGSPYVIDSSTLSAFDYQRVTVIPVSEEYFTETPSVHIADRSDYVAQYQIMFQTSRETEVMTVMDEFRDYFFSNKQFTLDGYNVSIKTTRGEKQPAVPVDRGDFYVRFKINVYLTAIKSGKIWSDTDTWSIRLKEITAGSFEIGKSYQIVTVGTTSFTSIGASANTVGVIFTATGIGTGTGTAIMTTVAIIAPTTYQQLKLESDTIATVGTSTFSNATGKALGRISTTALSSKISYFHNATEMEKTIYKAIMNKLDKDTQFELKHIFESDTFEYNVFISGGQRTRIDNAVKLFTFDWLEADI